MCHQQHVFIESSRKTVFSIILFGRCLVFYLLDGPCLLRISMDGVESFDDNIEREWYHNLYSTFIGVDTVLDWIWIEFKGKTADLKSKSTVKDKNSSKYFKVVQSSPKLVKVFRKYFELCSSILNYEKSMPHSSFCVRSRGENLLLLL